ncbi:olfactory receptor 6M1-like [Bombina bombina]|uniref:olfactory receptor 6M1-like n=1 Tax=Bombina bombina TaxID=8345 RepID=UPI00235AAB84|nr:olfactory receptor 6M1-like [Bombina bombina]
MNNATKNITTVSEFILLGFHFSPKIVVSFNIFLLLSYIFTITGNVLILSLVISDRRLHSPMYFFLCNLATLEIGFSNVVVPNMLRGLLPRGKYISLTGCMSQFYTFFLLGAADFYLLAVMSFDRYVAICHPLRYALIMTRRLCVQLMVGIGVGSFFYTLVPSILVMRLSFCDNMLNHFFCDLGPLLKNSCTDTTSIHLLGFSTSSLLLLGSLTVTIISYIYIVLAVLKIQTTEGREKAFSTCSSHALVVSLIYGSCIFMYVRPSQVQDLDIDKLVALLNAVVVPLLNPFIYALRNQKVKAILKERLCKTQYRSEK